MIPATLRFPLLLAATCAAWQPSKAHAADEETQFWLNANATGAIDDDTFLTIDSTNRWRDTANGDDQQTIRVAVEQKVADSLRIGGGIGVFDTAGLTEIRVHQQAVVSLGRIEARTRLEQRFFDGADRMELRFRQRITYLQPIATDWRGSAGVEWLALARPRDAGVGPSTDQWRFQGTVTHRVSRQLEIGAMYWLVVFPRGDRADQIAHVPQAVVTYRF